MSSTVCILQGKCDFSQGRKALVSKCEFRKESASFTRKVLVSQCELHEASAIFTRPESTSFKV